MKKLLSIIVIGLLFGCGEGKIEKPGNLIEKDKMVDIIYDLSLLDAIKSQRPIYLEESGINPRTYIYKKYNIDSLQFAKSNQYYSSDLVEYKKIFEEVAKRLDENKNLGKAPIANPAAPQIQ